MRGRAGCGTGLGWRSAAIGVFVVLLASYAYYWQSRDWNTASRLMLTYALVDRGTIRLDGLEEQTRDIARFEGHYYTDKLPGLSLLAVPWYVGAKNAFGLEPHPLNAPAMTHWPADYWATLGTSGLSTAALGALVVLTAGRLGASPRASALLGMAYGLATPAYVYGTLAYGHQATALFLMLGLLCLWPGEGWGVGWRFLMAGFCAGTACLVELQAAPAAAVLFALGVAQGMRSRRWQGPMLFLIGGVPAGLVLGAYNLRAFGSPLDMGYFHHATAQFAEVHSAENPLGLGAPAWSRAIDLIWGGYRGLLFYAPILMLAPLGWVKLAVDRKWEIVGGSVGVCLAFFLVNLSYPEWTGGWSTGPRLLVPIVPFAMLGVAAVVGGWGRFGTALAGVLALVGFVLMSLFVGVGGRIPQDIMDPLRGSVLPSWGGRPSLMGAGGEPFARNLAQGWLAGWVESLPRSERGLQFAPLWGFQGVAIGVLLMLCRGSRGVGGSISRQERERGEPDRPPGRDVEDQGSEGGEGA